MEGGRKMKQTEGGGNDGTDPDRKGEGGSGRRNDRKWKII